LILRVKKVAPETYPAILILATIIVDEALSPDKN
jgi:hypothetical protein